MSVGVLERCEGCSPRQISVLQLAIHSMPTHSGMDPSWATVPQGCPYAGVNPSWASSRMGDPAPVWSSKCYGGYFYYLLLVFFLLFF